MLSEGVIMYPVFGDLKPCISFVELSVFDAENDGKIDTVATYRYILHDSLGIVAKMSVDHGTAFTMQVVQCVHGFFGSPAVGLLEHDLSADRRIISMGNTLRIQTDDWGDGVMRLYFYDGTLHSVTDITPYNDQIVVEVESDYTRILFWSYTTKSGRLYRGSVVTH